MELNAKKNKSLQLTFLLIISQIVFDISTVGAFEPDFVFPLENVTIPQGRDATFTCVVNNLGGYRVSGDSASARVCIGLSSE